MVGDDGTLTLMLDGGGLTVLLTTELEALRELAGALTAAADIMEQVRGAT